MSLALPALLILLGTSTPSAGAAPDDPWPYQWPVSAPIVDGFRAPASPFAAGNRGLEFATVPGQEVKAAREGVVLFAGPVAGSLFVTIRHPDGVRTTSGHLASVLTTRGARVGGGTTIGLAGRRLHVSARIGDAYVDPAVLFGGAGGPPRLVPLNGSRVRAPLLGFGRTMWVAPRPSLSRISRVHSRPGADLGA